MNHTELKAYTDSLIAQQHKLQEDLAQLAVYGAGSFTYTELIQMPLSQIKSIESFTVNKIKLDRGIKEKSML